MNSVARFLFLSFTYKILLSVREQAYLIMHPGVLHIRGQTTNRIEAPVNI